MLPDNSKPSSPSSSTSSERQPLDVPAIVERFGNDRNFALHLLEKFQADAPGELAKLEKSLAGGDSAAATRSAHSLKSMAAYVTADKASNLACQIEELGRANQLAEMTTVVTALRQEIDWAILWIGKSEKVRALKCA
jgi:HPt (histidine-containing phosphotransfer) domain-containing protein